MTVKESLAKSIQMLNSPLGSFTLYTKLTGIENDEPIFESFNGKRLKLESLSSGEKNLFDSFPRSCVGMHTSPLGLFSGLSEGDWDLLIKVREAGNGLIRSAETPSEIRMHSHAGAWERKATAFLKRDIGLYPGITRDDKGLKPEARFFRVFRVFRCFRIISAGRGL